jgi:threonylcarbamoyladenosine tRNA methylthiotransferase MtaB
MLKYSVHAFGCKVSQVEASILGGVLGSSPGVPALDPSEADVLLVQTCSVTDRADRDDRKLIRELRRANPTGVLVVTGCLAQRDPEALARMPEVDLVIGHGLRHRLEELLEEREAGLLPGKIAWSPPGELPAIFWNQSGPRPPAFEGHTRSFLKIQDGCERRCSFCVVPSLRGAERSAPSSQVEAEIRRFGAEGIPEVVLAGVHLSNFGRDQGTSLLELINRLDSLPPQCRVRLSSLEPMEAGRDLIEAIGRSNVIAAHLHLPLQSGSDSVLRRMRRGITRAKFIELATCALEAVPDLHLATDLIAGFPGESDSEFLETLRLVEELPFASIHVFPFSPRSGTHAAAMNESMAVPRNVITERAAALRALSEEKALVFARRFDGRMADVVSLRGRRGLTSNYLDVALSRSDSSEVPPGRRLQARLQWRSPANALEAQALID